MTGAAETVRQTIAGLRSGRPFRDVAEALETLRSLIAEIPAQAADWPATAEQTLLPARQASPAHAVPPPPLAAELLAAADTARTAVFGQRVYCRGLIEFSNYCRNDCLYCGIRCSQRQVRRYRMDPAEILAACAEGYRLGFRTFVLQSGEDPWYDDERLAALVGSIRRTWPDCAVTLSIGERSAASYRQLYAAGARRYLLRHEAASPALYRTLHPPAMRQANRLACLEDLQAIGYQVGAGMMVGAPGQTLADLAADLIYLQNLRPQMVGIGPFLPAPGTPLADQPAGSVGLCLIMIALTRLLLPAALIPATTAMGTADPLGREKALAAGANVVMPNLTPLAHRADYTLYAGKICTGEEAAECLACLEKRIQQAGFSLDMARGDAPGFD